MAKKWINYFILTCILVGALSRLWLIFTLPSWIDEAFSIKYIVLPFLTIIRGSSDPTHPFGYYLFLKLWAIPSHHLIWLRLSSLAFYLCNCFLLWKIESLSKQKYFAYFLLFFYIFSGYFVIFDWQVRMYSGVVTLMFLSWFMQLRHNSVGFFLVTTVGLYFDYAFLWFAIPLTIYILARSQHSSEKLISLKSVALPWLVFSLWFPSFLNQYKSGANQVSWAIPFTNPFFFLPYFLGSHSFLITTVLFLIISGGGIYFFFKIEKEKDQSTQFFFFAGFFSFLLTILISMISQPIFHVRNLQIIGIAILFSYATFSMELWKKKKYLFLSLFLGLCIINFFWTLSLHYSSPGLLLLNFAQM